MAHLTLQLGGSVVVPFGAPQGVSRPRRRAVSARRLRWKALWEAALVAESADAVFCAIRLQHAQALHPMFSQAAAEARQGVSE